MATPQAQDSSPPSLAVAVRDRQGEAAHWHSCGRRMAWAALQAQPLSP